VKNFLEDPELVCISDRDKGLKAACEKVLATAYVKHFAIHLPGNLPGLSFGRENAPSKPSMNS